MSARSVGCKYRAFITVTYSHPRRREARRLLVYVTEGPQVTAGAQLGRQDPVSVYSSSMMLASFLSRRFLQSNNIALCGSKLLARAAREGEKRTPLRRTPAKAPVPCLSPKQFPGRGDVTIQRSRPQSCPPVGPGPAPAARRHKDLGRTAFPQRRRGR